MYRYRFLIAALTLTALTILLTVASSPAQAAPRSIPWDCSDWQETPAVADADDARVSMILESLAANRGKAIYCAIDQSDTWTKSETWLAGRDRNERDDTVYFGQQGNFRGFLAAQEGYLTDGESGVTGVSRELIFEFPREERRGKKTVIKRLKLEADPGRLARSRDGAASTGYSDEGSWTPTNWGSIGRAYRNFCNSGGPGFVTGTHQSYSHARYCQGIDWAPLVQAAAERDCAARGYPRVKEAAPSGSWSFQWRDPRPPGTYPKFSHVFWQVRQYTATCEKKIRVRRR